MYNSLVGLWLLNWDPLGGTSGWLHHVGFKIAYRAGIATQGGRNPTDHSLGLSLLFITKRIYDAYLLGNYVKSMCSLYTYIWLYPLCVIMIDELSLCFGLATAFVCEVDGGSSAQCTWMWGGVCCPHVTGALHALVTVVFKLSSPTRG